MIIICHILNLRPSELKLGKFLDGTSNILEKKVNVFLINVLLHLLGMVKLIKSIDEFMRMFQEKKKKGKKKKRSKMIQYPQLELI